MSNPSEPPADPGKPPGEAPESKPPATPPPAAETVVTGTKTERELDLERRLKSTETRVSELEDENRQLKTPKPTAPKKTSWLEEL